jgi:seryl-tRNA synthetase
MSSPASDPTTFYDELVRHGLLIPAGPLGAFGRGPVFESVLEAFDRLVVRTSKDDGVESMTFPPVIDRMIIERTGYMESFPTLCGAVHSFVGNEREARALAQQVSAGEPWGDALSQTDLVLNPAACYPFYPTCTGTVPATGRHVTFCAWVYRQEPSIEPTRMRSFRVREYIRLGPPDVVIAWRDHWLKRGTAILEALALPARADVAADPFFGRAGKILAAGQIEQKLKFEVLVPVVSEEHPTACCSFNYHQDKFGSAFNIKLPNGESAHSACLGFGLERVTMALFKTHGYGPKSWPASVRNQLWP